MNLCKVHKTKVIYIYIVKGYRIEENIKHKIQDSGHIQEGEGISKQRKTYEFLVEMFYFLSWLVGTLVFIILILKYFEYMKQLFQKEENLKRKERRADLKVKEVIKQCTCFTILSSFLY